MFKNKLAFFTASVSLPYAFTAFAADVSVTDLWNSYKSAATSNPVRLSEHQNKVISYNNLQMKYEYSKKGEKPKNGYPLYIALHGGGGAPAWLNDSQWDHMKIYYRDSVESGIYLAPRGATNTWDLHFVPESYVMYDRLIENMVLFEDVDPNKVYILGFSAGGDGTYQIAARMADRFAGANMSAGHPNWLPMNNVYNLPFLIQVGEMDGAYNRNKVDAEYCGKLAELRKQNPDGYVSQCFVHFNKPHNFYDNDAGRSPQAVLSNPANWLATGDRTSYQTNTNAIDWLKNHTRNPLPNKVVWDLTTRANRTGVDSNQNHLWSTDTHGTQQYWLDVGTGTNETLGTNEIVARYDTSANKVVVEKAANNFKILLNESMVNFARSVQIEVEGTAYSLNLTKNSNTMSNTLLSRGDVNYVFEAAVQVKKEGSSWTVAQVD